VHADIAHGRVVHPQVVAHLDEVSFSLLASQYGESLTARFDGWVVQVVA